MSTHKSDAKSTGSTYRGPEMCWENTGSHPKTWNWKCKFKTTGQKASRQNWTASEKPVKYKFDDLTVELETASSKCLHLDAKSQVLRQELLSMK